jgi:hypothetical protein
MRLLLPVILKGARVSRHTKPNCGGQTPLPSKDDETPATGDLEEHQAAQTHNLDFAQGQHPPPRQRRL